jgi:uncharacterized protein YjbJ (UPF0337 family)
MNQEQFKESWGQLKGHLGKHWDKLTDDDLLQIAGDQNKFNDAIEKRYGAIKGEVSKWADRWYAKWIGWYEGYEELIPASQAVQKVLSV